MTDNLSNRFYPTLGLLFHLNYLRVVCDLGDVSAQTLRELLLGEVSGTVNSS